MSILRCYHQRSQLILSKYEHYQDANPSHFLYTTRGFTQMLKDILIWVKLQLDMDRGVLVNCAPYCSSGAKILISVNLVKCLYMCHQYCGTRKTTHCVLFLHPGMMDCCIVWGVWLKFISTTTVPPFSRVLGNSEFAANHPNQHGIEK